MERFIALAIDRAWESCDDKIEVVTHTDSVQEAARLLREDASCILDTKTGKLYHCDDRFGIDQQILDEEQS